MGQIPDLRNSEQAFPLHDEGKFGFTVIKATDETENGEPIIRTSDGEAMAFVTLGPDIPNTNRPNVLIGFTLNEQWMWKLREFVEALGFPIDGSGTFEHLVGKKVIGYVTHTQSKGKTYANIKAWEPYPAAGAETKRVSQSAPQPQPGNDGLPF
jgi:hypothetical protein